MPTGSWLRRLLAACAGMVLCAAAAELGAQAYPARTIHLIVPYAAGSGTDALARLLAEKLGTPLGQSVVVENQPGANGIPASAAVARAAPDGYTLLMVANNHVVNASLYSKLPFDPVKDFTPILRLIAAGFVLTVHPSLPVADFEDFVAYAKARPGTINYASPGSGSNPHLVAELLNTLAGIKLVHVPYKGSAQAQSDVIGGHVPVMFMVASNAIPLVKNARLRALGVTSAARLPQLPEVRTMEEAGVKGIDLNPWVGMIGPAALPQNIVAKLASEITRIMREPATLERVKGLGFETALMQPEEFAPFMANEAARSGEIVRRSGARLD